MTRRVSRRGFLRAGAAAAAAAVAFPGRARAAGRDQPVLRAGLIGCGGRGTGAAEDCLKAHPCVRIVALADLFPDRLAGCRKQLAELQDQRVEVSDARCFTGWDAWRRLLDLPLDLVLLASPPGFRPLHFAAAIDAGMHVFLEKPVAVDPVGVRKVLAAGERAAARRLAVVAGTQRRHHRGYVEAIGRIHDGQIGRIVAARCTWNQGGLWHKERASGEDDMSWQCRNWLYFTWLSGDHIVEQHVHNLDVINWALRAHPVRAVAVGGRQVRTAPVYGNVWDHFGVDYEYPGGVHVTSFARQMAGTDGHVGEVIVGTKGWSNPSGRIEGERPWTCEGEIRNPYEQEHVDLVASILGGEPLNETRAIAEATLTGILGREAAYTGAAISWDDVMKSDQDLSPPTYGFGPLPVRPVAVPGTRS